MNIMILIFYFFYWGDNVVNVFFNEKEEGFKDCVCLIFFVVIFCYGNYWYLVIK